MRNAYKILFEKQAKGVCGKNKNGLKYISGKWDVKMWVQLT